MLDRLLEPLLQTMALGLFLFGSEFFLVSLNLRKLLPQRFPIIFLPELVCFFNPFELALMLTDATDDFLERNSFLHAFG